MTFKHHYYNSPAPVILHRVEPSLHTPDALISKTNPKLSNLSRRKYRSNQYISIVVTSSIAKGGTGQVHRANLDVVRADAETHTCDAVIKFAFSKVQQAKLRYEYSIFEHLATSELRGIPIVLGLFEPVEGGPLVMLSTYCGVDLLDCRKLKDSWGLKVSTRERLEVRQ